MKAIAYLICVEVDDDFSYAVQAEGEEALL